MHVDVEAESADQAATWGEAITVDTLARADLRSAFQVHELTDPSGTISSVGDFDGWAAGHDLAYKPGREP